MVTSFYKLIKRTIALVKESKYEAIYTHYSRRKVISILTKYKIFPFFLYISPMEEIQLLFGPTGCIQEIAINNGWSEEYMDIAKKIDNLVGDI